MESSTTHISHLLIFIRFCVFYQSILNISPFLYPCCHCLHSRLQCPFWITAVTSWLHLPPLSSSPFYFLSCHSNELFKCAAVDVSRAWMLPVVSPLKQLQVVFPHWRATLCSSSSSCVWAMKSQTLKDFLSPSIWEFAQEFPVLGYPSSLLFKFFHTWSCINSPLTPCRRIRAPSLVFPGGQTEFFSSFYLSCATISCQLWKISKLSRFWIELLSSHLMNEWMKDDWETHESHRKERKIPWESRNCDFWLPDLIACIMQSHLWFCFTRQLGKTLGINVEWNLGETK